MAVPSTLDDAQAHLSVLRTLIRALQAAAPPDELTQIAVDRLRQAFPPFRAFYAEIDQAGALRIVESQEPRKKMPVQRGRKVDVTAAETYLSTLRAGGTVVAENVAQDDRLKPLANFLSVAQAAALVHVPIEQVDGAVSLLGLEAPALCGWDGGEVDLLEDVASQLALGFARHRQQARARQARQDTADSYRLLDQVSDVVITTDLNQRITYANAAACQMYGRDREDVLGQSISDLLPYRYADGGSDEAAAAAIAAGKTWQAENVVLLPDGSERLVAGTTQLRQGPDGKPRGLFIVSRDITAQRDLETFERFFALTSDMQCVASSEGLFVQLNDAWSAALGYTAEELMAKPFLEFVHPDDRQRTIDEFEGVLEGDNTPAFSNRYRAKDGSYRHLEWTSITDLETGYIYATARDVTAREEAMQALRESEAKLATFFHAVPDALIITSLEEPAGRIVEVNDGFEQVTGFTRDDAVGRMTEDLKLWVSDDDRQRYLGLLHERGRVRNFEAEIRLRSGETRIGLISAEIMQVDGVPCVLAIVRDVTVQRRAEQALHQSRERLVLALRGADLGLWDVNLTTRQCVFNERWASMLGYRLADIAPTLDAFERLVHPDDLPRLQDAAEAHYEGRAPHFEAEFRMQARDGSWRWVLSRGQIVKRAPDGTPLRTTGTHLDITERKHAERALKRQQRLLALSQEMANLGSWSWEADEGRAFWSEQMYRIFGVDPETFDGDTDTFVRSVVHPDDRPAFEAAWQAMLEEHRTDPLEYRIIRPDGEERIIWAEGEPITDGAGHLIRVTGTAQDVTEKRRTEQALQESEQLYRLLAENATDVIAMTDVDYAFRYVSPAAEKLFGYRPDEVDAVSLEDVLTPEALALVRQSHEARVATEAEGRRDDTPLRAELEHIRKDGTTFWAEVVAVPLRDSAGRITGYVSNTRDITERRQAEEAMRRSEFKFRLLFERSGLYVAIVDDMDRRTFKANPALTQLFGYSAEELRTMTAYDLIHPDDHDLDAEQLAQIRRGESDSYEVEKRYVRKDGTVLWMRVANSIIRDDDGEPIFAASVLEDITERKRAEQAIQESEARFRSAFIHAPVGMALVGIEGTYRQVNPALCRMLGYAAGELEGRHFSDLTHPEDMEASVVLYESLQAAPDPSSSHQLQKRYVRKDGSEQWALMTASPVRREDDDSLYAIVQMLDLNQQKQYEQALIEAKEAAEEMSRLKSTFLANMSHEIRTPLTAVIGFASVLAEEVSGTQQELVNHIVYGGERLLSTLNSVLDLSMLESGSLRLCYETCDIVREVRAKVDTLNSLALSKGIDLRVEGPQEPLFVAIDRACLDRILNNLVGNAIKFTEAGEVVVSVQAQRDAFVLTVRDTGVGIEETFLPYLFDAFKQESAGMARSHEGSGLGLTITKRLVDLLGGEIAVASAKGLGSRFVVRLPIRAGDQVTPVRPDEEQAEVLQMSRPHVLLVEDKVEMVYLVKQMLGAAYEIEAAAEEAAALHLAKAHDFDLVLMDINLNAEATGVDVLEALRQLPAYTTVPIVAVTAYALPEDQARFLAAGFDAYLAKPFTRDQLRHLVRRLLPEGRRAGGASGRHIAVDAGSEGS